MPVFCLFTLGRPCNFTAGVTLEQPDLLCTALALNIVPISSVTDVSSHSVLVKLWGLKTQLGRTESETTSVLTRAPKCEPE